MKYLPACVLAVSWLACCETIIEIDPPDYDGELTVLSYFNNDSTWSARVSQTLPVGTAQYVDDPFLDDAKVTVWDGDGLIDELAHDGNGSGWYTSPANLRPKVGVSYTMKVEADGFHTAVATSAIPAIPALSEAKHEKMDPDGYRVRYTIDDPPEDNYYIFDTYLGYPLPSSEGGHTRYALDLLQMMRSDRLWHCSYVYAADPLPDFEEAEDECSHGVMTDRLFNGRPQELEFTVQIDPDEQREAPILLVVFHSVSASFFEYKRTIQLDELSNPFSEPVRIYSNFEGARGVFAGFSTNYLVFNLTEVG